MRLAEGRASSPALIFWATMMAECGDGWIERIEGWFVVGMFRKTRKVWEREETTMTRIFMAEGAHGGTEQGKWKVRGVMGPRRNRKEGQFWRGRVNEGH